MKNQEIEIKKYTIDSKTAEKLRNHVGKWVKVTIKDYNYISYIKVLSVKKELDAIQYSLIFQEHFQDNSTKADSFEISDKKSYLCMGKENKFQFLKEFPVSLKKKWLKLLEKQFMTIQKF